MQESMLLLGKHHIYVTSQYSAQPTTLIFIHGNSLSSRFWQPQFESDLSRYFNLLALDLPGHGQSEPAADPISSYSLSAYGQVILDLLNQQKIVSFVLIGHSLGGHVVLELLPFLSEFTCRGVVVVGTPPLQKPWDQGQPFLPNPNAALLFQEQATDEALEALSMSMVRPGGEAWPLLPETYRQTDPLARITFIQNTLTGQYQDEVALIHSSFVPVLLAYGEKEQIVNPAYFQSLQLPDDCSIMEIPQAGHLASYENPAFFNDLLKGQFA
ncbi:alpha/beta fold hydrolase [Catalinimonas niigatensis]|uniref:alpha/beta fold hydrolase n=1 Tax=Catalinimonas niigatensis TaxID=1397264 RepID=UPI002665F532|nr:alpha/beta hydrolase [Catalinimonas niigatensis]WPP48672.1 alpha/beta hydrolase [Catalinimonas niigatensis]